MRAKSSPKFNSDFEPDHPLSQPSKFKYLPLLVLVLLLLNLLTTCNNSKVLQMAVKNQPYIYVQNPDGTTSQASPAIALDRSDAVVSKFGEDWLKIAYTWKVSPEKGKPFVTERSVDFPYQFYKASLAIAPGYREAYMNLTAQKYQREFPFGNYITGQRQSYVRIYDASKVRLVEKGVWDVTIVATRIHASGDSILAQEIFNRVIRVRAIAPASNERLLWGERDTHLGRLLNQMQYQGLQIVQIDEF